MSSVPFNEVMRGVVLCALLSLAGCEEGSEYEVFSVLPSVGYDYYDINGHWVGQTGSGYELSMDLNNSSNSNAMVTGQMHRRGTTGSFDGILNAGAHETARMSFTVKWPDGARTTGDVAISDHEKMINGSLDDEKTSDTFTAERQ